MNILRLSLRCACAAALLSACGSDPDTTATETAGSTGDSEASSTTASSGDASTGATTGASTDEPTTGATTATGTDASTGATTGGGVADCGFDPNLVFERGGLVFQMQSEDGETCVWLKRRDDAEPDVIYKAWPYTLLEFKAGHDGKVVHVTDLASLHWESTHHNWNDWATAQGEGVKYRLDDLFATDMGGQEFVDSRWALSATDANDQPLWGPIILYPYPK